jgi:translocator protein
MMTNRALSVLNVFALLATLVANALANLLPINGMNTGQVSELYPSLFTPAGITFSIWSVIYLLLIAFAIIQLYSFYTKPSFKKLATWFVFSCILNASWIVAWHYLWPELSLLIMVALLFSLIKIFLHLNRHPVTTLYEKAFVRLPFTTYLAWICVATIANASAVFVVIPDFSMPFGEETWTIIMMITAASLALYITLKFKAPAFSAVVIWALFGIFLRWQKTEHSILATVAVVLVIVLSSVYIYSSQKVLRER